MASKSDPKRAVVKYLKMQNRPYSANDITQNLHKEFGKTAIQKALDELSSSGNIKEKLYGKQKVYAPIQETETDQQAMESILTQLDVQINEASASLTRTEQELKAVENELKEYTNQTSTEEARKMESELLSTVEKLELKLESLSKTTVKISADEKKKIAKENEVVVKEYRKRKRICMDIANTILENYPKPKRAFYEEVGIETDEDVSR